MERGKENEREREEEGNNASNPSLLPPDSQPCSVRPPRRCAAAMSHTESFLTPSNFNCKSLFETNMGLLAHRYDGHEGSETKGSEAIKKFQCNKKGNLCAIGVIIVIDRRYCTTFGLVFNNAGLYSSQNSVMKKKFNLFQDLFCQMVALAYSLFLFGMA